MKIAAIVILYNPSADFVQNILSYLGAVSMLIIVDNSLGKLDPGLLASLSDGVPIQYIHKPQNIGIAAALNIGAEIALSEECSHLLTMDQDSRFQEGDFIRFLQSCRSICADRFGIAVPCHSSEVYLGDVRGAPRKVAMSMTSGSLLNLKAYVECGAFDESLFIDHVDHEYCLRLNSRGWEVWEIQSVVLNHQLGKRKEIKLFGKRIREIVSHAPQRDYYVVRNGLAVIRKYRGENGVAHIKRCLRDVVVKAVFFERDRIQRLGWLIRAVKDYRQNKMGKAG